VEFHTASVSDAGGRRRNEDAFGIWRGAGRLACVVADGAGGHGGGDVASRVVVDTVLAELSRIDAGGVPLSGPNLRRVLLRANDAVVDAQEDGGALADMRSTVVLLAIDATAGLATWAHCGDTRLYCFRGGATRIQTQDHSVVQSMLDANLLPEQDVRHHPRRNVLFSALGTTDELSIAVPDTPFEIADGDAFLLCTDGFWEYVDEAAMIAAIAQSDSPDRWLAARAARLRESARPGQDNFTATALWCGEPSQVTILRAP
jgi:serine/threonine protein phosphatase PrpC